MKNKLADFVWVVSKCRTFAALPQTHFCDVSKQIQTFHSITLLSCCHLLPSSHHFQLLSSAFLSSILPSVCCSHSNFPVRWNDLIFISRSSCQRSKAHWPTANTQRCWRVSSGSMSLHATASSVHFFRPFLIWLHVSDAQHNALYSAVLVSRYPFVTSA